jgi:hypothetical protein
MGGFKVTYEYANRLAAHGHHATVVHTPRADRTRFPSTIAKRWVVYAGRPLNVAALPLKVERWLETGFLVPDRPKSTP